MSDVIKEKVNFCLSLAEQKFHRCFHYDLIQMNLRGRSAGQIKYDYGVFARRSPVLRFNPDMLSRYGLEFVDSVVPHECAHLVAYALHGFRIKPHGKEWKGIMSGLYKLEPLVTHRFEVQKRRQYQRYAYQCLCEKGHQLSSIRHKRVVQKQAQYICRLCGNKLEKYVDKPNALILEPRVSK